MVTEGLSISSWKHRSFMVMFLNYVKRKKKKHCGIDFHNGADELAVAAASKQKTVT